jgi:TP901 family phage tail tape measure protein
MADKKIKRGIYLYIDGKQIKNDVNGIQNEMRKLTAEQRKMTIGSDEYVRHAKKIQQLDGILKKHRADLRKTKDSVFSLKKMADGFNNYFGLVTAGIASLTGVVMGFRKTIDVANEFEERVDNLSALTGLAGKELDWLAEKAKESSVSQVEGGVRIKQSASDIVDAYTKMGSQRPELLKNKEALAEVTEKAIILSEAGKMELEPATAALATTLNQFNDEAEDSSRHINAIAAGSKEGAGDIPYITSAVEKFGTTFASMGGSIEQGVGLIETVAPKFKEARTAGNSLDKVLLKMKDQQIGYKNGVFDMNYALDELSVRFQNGESATKIFGAEHAKMIDVLMQGQSEYNRYTEAVTGTNTAIEQASTNTDNNASKLAQARNKFQLISIELGQKLAPAMTFSTNSFSYLMKAIMAAPEFWRQNQILILALAGAFLAWNARVIESIALQVKDRTVKLLSIAADKLQIVTINAKAVATKIQIALTGKATIAQKRLIVQQKALNAAMKANPIGLVIAAFTALVAAIKLYDKYNAKSRQLEEEKIGAIEDIQEATETLNEKYEQIHNSISNLNKLSVEEKKNLQEKTQLTIDQAEAELILLQAKKDQVFEDNSRATLWQRTKNFVLSAGNAAVKAGLDATNAVQNGTDAAEELTPALEQLQDRIDALKGDATDLNNIMQAEQQGDDIGTETMAQLEEKLAKYNLALKHAKIGSEEFKRLQGKIQNVQGLINDLKSKDIEIETNVKGAEEAKKQLEDLQDTIIDYYDTIEKFRLSADEKELRQIDQKYEQIYLKLEEAKEAELTLLKRKFDKGKMSEQDYTNQRKAIIKRYNKDSLDLQQKHGEDIQKKTDEQEDKRNKSLSDKKQKYIDADIDNLEKAFANETIMRKAEFNKKMASLQGNKLEQKKLQEQFEKEELERQQEHLEELMLLFQDALSTGQWEGIQLDDKLLSPEQKAEIEGRLEELKASLAELGLTMAEVNTPDQQSFDILGYSSDDWQVLFDNLTNAKLGVEDIELAANAMVNIFSTFNEIQSNIEEKELEDYKEKNEEKKADLQERLDSGLLSQSDYNKGVEKLDDSLAAKEEKLQDEADKREKASALLGAIVNTSMAITKALTIAPPAGIALAALVGTMGALEIAKIESAYEDGGMTPDKESVIMVSEKGREWISPNWMLEDPVTGPIIKDLEMVRTGKLQKTAISMPISPDYQSMSTAAIKAFSAGGYNPDSTSSTRVDHVYHENDTHSDSFNSLLQEVREMKANQQKLIQYLSDPANRQAYMTYDTMTKAQKEMDDLNDLSKF